MVPVTVERTLVDPAYYSSPVTWATVYALAEYPVYPYDCTIGSYGSSLAG